MAYIDLESKEFETELKEKPEIVLIDCRTPAEFASGHLKNAINYNFNSGEFEDMIPQLEKEHNYFIYCRSGARSAAAANILINSGFSKVTNLLGGILGWNGEVV